MAKEINKYIVPFTLEGELTVNAKDIEDLRKVMDEAMVGDLFNTAENVEFKAFPDRAEKIASIKKKLPKEKKDK